MGNYSSSLSSRLRDNDASLEALELTCSPKDLCEHNWNALLRAMKRNHTVRAVVITDAFTSDVEWRPFLESLVCLQSLEQVELLETGVPFSSLVKIVGDVKKLKYLAVHEGVSVGISLRDVQSLADSINEKSSLEEFTFEHDFSSLARDKYALDPLVLGLCKLSNLKLLTLSSIQNPASINSSFFSNQALFTLGRSSPCLETLDLSGCGLTVSHFNIIKEAFSRHPSLRNLYLERNLANQFSALLELLIENYRLQTLVTDAKGRVRAQLNHWLFLNQNVREPLITSKTTPGALVVQMKNSLNAIFYIIKEHPTLCLEGIGEAV